MTMASSHDVLEVSRPPEQDEPTTSTQNEVPILEDLQKRTRTPKPRPVSLQNPTTSDTRVAWRRSYHKDVEEALSSLLWEPYDCRDSTEAPEELTYYWQQNDSSLSSDMLSLSSVSLTSTVSSCNSYCCDGKKLTQSFTDEFVPRQVYGGTGFSSYSDTTFECQNGRNYFVPSVFFRNVPTSFTDEFVPQIVTPPQAFATTCVNGVTNPTFNNQLSDHHHTTATQSNDLYPCALTSRDQQEDLHNTLNNRSHNSGVRNDRNANFTTVATITSKPNTPPPPGSCDAIKMRLSVPPQQASRSRETQPIATESQVIPVHARSNSASCYPVSNNNVQRNTQSSVSGSRIQINPNFCVPVTSSSSAVFNNRVQVTGTGSSLTTSHGRSSSAITSTSSEAVPNRVIQQFVTSSSDHSIQSPQYAQNIIHTRVPSLPISTSSPTSTTATCSTSTVSVVNCYRAVPVNVVSNVPTIQCLNSATHVSNVQIVDQTPRTFTSTEAQTDDIPKEQRRKERRGRRPPRVNNHPHTERTVSDPVSTQGLPDLLNSHLPPPYSTLPHAAPQPQPPPVVAPQVVRNVLPPPISFTPGTQLGVPVGPPVVPNVPFTQMPPQQTLMSGVSAPSVPVSMVPVTAHPTSGGLRFLQFQNPVVGMRRSRRSGQTYTSEDQPKSCCGMLLTQTISIRWFIVMIAFVGVCCAIVGTILGAMKASGREHLTVSLLMIGVGIILITVSGVAWRLTSHDAPTCRAMLGLGGSDDGTAGDSCTRRFVPRLPPSYGRPHHPYAAMMYPEFQYRPPPPSYQASMQEYRLRLLLLDRHAPVLSPAGVQHTVTPPPTYRSQPGTLLRAPLSNRRDQAQSEYSCPPSYRSRTSSNRPVLDPNGTGSILNGIVNSVVGTTNNSIITGDHSREHSLSESNGSVVNVVSILTSHHDDNLKVVPESDITPLRMLLKSDGLDPTKEGNLVTIVQTSSDQSPVIVTVSGSQMSTGISGGEMNSEMEILAHL